MRARKITAGILTILLCSNIVGSSVSSAFAADNSAAQESTANTESSQQNWVETTPSNINVDTSKQNVVFTGYNGDVNDPNYDARSGSLDYALSYSPSKHIRQDSDGETTMDGQIFSFNATKIQETRGYSYYGYAFNCSSNPSQPESQSVPNSDKNANVRQHFTDGYSFRIYSEYGKPQELALYHAESKLTGNTTYRTITGQDKILIKETPSIIQVFVNTDKVLEYNGTTDTKNAYAGPVVKYQDNRNDISGMNIKHGIPKLQFTYSIYSVIPDFHFLLNGDTMPILEGANQTDRIGTVAAAHPLFCNTISNDTITGEEWIVQPPSGDTRAPLTLNHGITQHNPDKPDSSTEDHYEYEYFQKPGIYTVKFRVQLNGQTPSESKKGYGQGTGLWTDYIVKQITISGYKAPTAAFSINKNYAFYEDNIQIQNTSTDENGKGNSYVWTVYNGKIPQKDIWKSIPIAQFHTDTISPDFWKQYQPTSVNIPETFTIVLHAVSNAANLSCKKDAIQYLTLYDFNMSINETVNPSATQGIDLGETATYIASGMKNQATDTASVMCVYKIQQKDNQPLSVSVPGSNEWVDNAGNTIDSYKVKVEAKPFESENWETVFDGQGQLDKVIYALNKVTNIEEVRVSMIVPGNTYCKGTLELTTIPEGKLSEYYVGKTSNPRQYHANVMLSIINSKAPEKIFEPGSIVTNYVDLKEHFQQATINAKIDSNGLNDTYFAGSDTYTGTFTVDGTSNGGETIHQTQSFQKPFTLPIGTYTITDNNNTQWFYKFEPFTMTLNKNTVFNTTLKKKLKSSSIKIRTHILNSQGKPVTDNDYAKLGLNEKTAYSFAAQLQNTKTKEKYTCNISSQNNSIAYMDFLPYGNYTIQISDTALFHFARYTVSDLSPKTTFYNSQLRTLKLSDNTEQNIRTATIDVYYTLAVHRGFSDYTQQPNDIIFQ